MVCLCTYRVRKCSGLFMYVQSEEVQWSLFMYVQSEEVQWSVYVRTE